MVDPITLGAGLTLATNVWNSFEAKRNRDFQERMSSTAHQREVLDLQRAGINPAMSARLGGSSTPGGDRAQLEDVGRGVNTGLALKRSKAELELLDAQRDETSARALLARTQAADISMTAAGGRYDQLRATADIAQLDARQRQEIMPTAIERAKAEVEQLQSSARASQARAMLDEAARTGALNREEFERVIGELGPWAKFLLELLKGVRP